MRHGARKGELLGPPNPPVPPSGPNELNVALYPFVPSPQAFVAVTQREWSRVQPEVRLNFVMYSPYEEPLDPNLDVFAFDCIFADDLAKRVDPIAWDDIRNGDDILPFARNCARLDGDRALGVPYLGCTSVLYYRAGDPDLDNSSPLGTGELEGILGAATDPGPAPPAGKGLIMDLGSKTTNACIYASMWRQGTQRWWPSRVPMQMPPSLDQGAMAGLAAYARMTGRGGALYEDFGHDRTEWFRQGLGCALVGITETMSAWPADFLESIRFRPLPIALNGNAARIPCYADAIGIRPGLGAKRAWAVQLANLVASPQVLLAALYPSPTTQYVIPARRSVLTQLGRMRPKYRAIETMLGSLPLEPLRLGPGVKEWAKPAGAAIIKQLFPGVSEEQLAAPPPRRRHAYHATPAGIWRRGE